MNRPIFILTLALNIVAFVALTVALLFVIEAPQPAFTYLVLSIVTLLGCIAGEGALILWTNVHRPERLPADAPIVHVPPPGTPERRDVGNPGRRSTDVPIGDVVRTIRAVERTGQARGMSYDPQQRLSYDDALSAGLIDPLDLESTDDRPEG